MEVYAPKHFTKWREELRGDFRKFLFVLWKRLNLPNPTQIQYEIGEYLQHGPERKIIEGFRGVGKSWITSGYVLWSLDRDPELKFLVVSAAKDRADAFSTFTKRLIHEIDFLQYLRPDERKGQRDSMVQFDVGPSSAAHAPSVKSVGIFGQITGTRAHEIIADDIEVPNNSATEDMREKLLNRALEFEAIIVPEIGKITYLGTPQTEESIYNRLRERGYKARIWPARYPERAKIVAYQGALAPSIEKAVEKDESIAGQPTDPSRFTDLDLFQREASYGRSNFALQFMLDTSLSDAERYPLKLADLIIMPLDKYKGPVNLAWGSSPDLQYKDLPNIGFAGDRWYKPFFVDQQWTDYEGSLLAIDPAGRGDNELAYNITKQLHGRIFLLAEGGLSGGYADDNLVLLAKLAREFKVNYCIIEANMGDGMFTKIFRPVLAKYHECTIEEVKHSTQKEKRIIDTLEPVMNQHRLVVDYGLVKKELHEITSDVDERRRSKSLFYQLTRIFREKGALKYDDRVDCLAIAVAYWVESMARDRDRAVQEFEERELQKELDEFITYALGRERDTWDLREAFLRR